MKKFMLLHYGYVTPTPEIMEAWGNWFASIADKTVDPGNRFGPGREITHTGTKELAVDTEAITGYTVVQAETMEEAVTIAQGCPSITSIRVYEAMSM